MIVSIRDGSALIPSRKFTGFTVKYLQITAGARLTRILKKKSGVGVGGYDHFFFLDHNIQVYTYSYCKGLHRINIRND